MYIYYYQCDNVGLCICAFAAGVVCSALAGEAAVAKP